MPHPESIPLAAKLVRWTIRVLWLGVLTCCMGSCVTSMNRMHCGAYRSSSSFHLNRLEELQALLVQYRVDTGRYPENADGFTWFEQLQFQASEEFAIDYFADYEDNRFTCDRDGHALVYELPGGALADPMDESTWPILRMVGENGIDDHGRGDDLDIRFGVNWGYWEKSHWTQGLATGVVAAILIAILIWMLRRSTRHERISCLVESLCLTLLIVPLSATPYQFSFEPRSLPALLNALFAIGLITSLGWLPLVLRGVRDRFSSWYRGELSLAARRAKHGCCVHCGYSLVGNVSGRCPECGVVINTEIDDAPGVEECAA